MSQVVLGLIAVLSISGFGVAVATASRSGDGIEQPVPFGHALHAKLGVGCTDCHAGVLVRARATLPRIAMCAECHADVESTNEVRARVREHVDKGTEIPWRRLYTLPAHVVFSHERHAGIGAMECAECHGAHGESVEPPRAPEGWVLTMDGCVDCHEARGASVDCVACHR